MPDQTASEVLQPLIAVAILFIVLNTIFVALRFISRSLVKKSELGWDDWLLIPGYMVNIALCALGLAMAHYEAIGNPPAHVPIGADPAQLETQLFPVLKIIFAIELIVTPGYLLPKLSILALYLRIFEVRWMQITTRILIGLLVAIWFAWAMTAIFQCTPVNYFWNRTIEGHCIHIDSFYRSFNPPNIATDLVILALPIPAVWKLQVSTIKKLGLTCIFMTGSIGLVASCVRLAYFWKYTSEVIIPYTTTPLIALTIAEPGLYLIAACLPAMRPVFQAMTPRFLSSWVDKKTTTNYSGFTPHASHGMGKDGKGSKAYGSNAGFERLVHPESGSYGAVAGRVSSRDDSDPGVALHDLRGIGVKTDIEVSHHSYAAKSNV